MIGKRITQNGLTILIIAVSIFVAPHVLFSDNKQPEGKVSTLCKEAIQYNAFIQKKVLTLIAFGSHRTDGWKVALEREVSSDSTNFRFILKHTPPTGPVLQVITPFVVWDYFQIDSSPKSVTVVDGNDQHNIQTKWIK